MKMEFLLSKQGYLVQYGLHQNQIKDFQTYHEITIWKYFSFIILFMARQKELFASLNVSKSRTILDEVQ